MKTIVLTQGYVTMVDDWNYERLNRYKWHVTKRHVYLYATRSYSCKGHKNSIGMHNVIIGIKGVDHINGNGLDNRECNLRPASRSQNAANRGPQKNNTSGYKGVYWHAKMKKWRAMIMVKPKLKSLGLFDDIKDAANAYNEAAKKYYGNYAKLNNPKIEFEEAET